MLYTPGTYLVSPIGKTSPLMWHELLYTNLYAPILLTQALLPTLIEGKGSLLFFGVHGVQTKEYFTKAPLYFCVKKALFSFVLSLAKEHEETPLSPSMLSIGHNPVEEVINSVLVLLQDFCHTGRHLEI
jgi:NADP-dependent 3-hydroxy acid dehydrogenase YdfG